MVEKLKSGTIKTLVQKFYLTEKHRNIDLRREIIITSLSEQNSHPRCVFQLLEITGGFNY